MSTCIEKEIQRIVKLGKTSGIPKSERKVLEKLCVKANKDLQSKRNDYILYASERSIEWNKLYEALPKKTREPLRGAVKQLETNVLDESAAIEAVVALDKLAKIDDKLQREDAITSHEILIAQSLLNEVSSSEARLPLNKAADRKSLATACHQMQKIDNKLSPLKKEREFS